MPSKLRAFASKAKSFVSQNKGKLALGLAGATALGVGAYAVGKNLKGGKKARRQSLARIRTKRRIWQEKVKLERAKKSYERVMSQ